MVMVSECVPARISSRVKCSGSGRSAVLRGIVPEPVAAATVHARALQLFVERGIHETRDRSGVLILVSELERRVEILADRGIHERVEAGEWQRDVDELVSSIRGGHAADGVVAVVERIGGLLAQSFPPRADDENELPDEVLRIDSCAVPGPRRGGPARQRPPGGLLSGPMAPPPSQDPSATSIIQ